MKSVINNPLKDLLSNKKKTELKRNTQPYLGHANRGLDFEFEINITNDWYKENNIALITKRPTPIKVIRMNTNTGIIEKAVYEKQSTLDYNGVYDGHYIEFEAKQTNNNSLPITNFQEHQLVHIRKVINHQGIVFVLISFRKYNEVYFLEGKRIVEAIDNNKRSLSYNFVKETGYPVVIKYNPRIDYIEILRKILTTK